jgi:hypothetical protein
MPDQVAPSAQPQEGILNKSLSDVLMGNPQAQNMVMQSMGINQQQLQSMLSQSANNPMMHMPISDLFKNGVVQQAVQMNGAQQVSPQQFQQMLGAMNMQNGQTGMPMMPNMPQNMQVGNMGTPMMIPVGMVQMPVNGSGMPVSGMQMMQMQKPSLMQKVQNWFRLK